MFQIINLQKLTKKLGKINHVGIKRALIFINKETKNYLTCKLEKKTLKKRIKKQLKTKNKIQIGGGKNYLQGFINIDLKKPADIIYDVREGMPFPALSINYVFTEHFLEHIDYPKSVKKFFSETFRTLKPGGKLIIGVPDSELIIKAYTKNKKHILKKIKKEWYSKRSIYKDINTKIDIVNLVMRDEDANKKYNPHLWGYDEEKLKYLFKKSGFKNIKNWKFNKKTGNQKRKFGSIYIEGTKK